MSVNPKFIQLLEKLKEATSQGRLEWRDTVDENTFRVLLDDAIVRVGKQFDDESKRYYYQATLANNYGSELVSLTSDDADDNRCRTLLPELFELARKNANKVDELLDRLIASVASRNPQHAGGGR